VRTWSEGLQTSALDWSCKESPRHVLRSAGFLDYLVSSTVSGRECELVFVGAYVDSNGDVPSTVLDTAHRLTPVSLTAYYSTLKMEAIFSSETPFEP
jgi:hypothetical protein